MENKILGVYIPTYNRKGKLAECLNSFIPQMRKHGFPIYVSDNGSTDGTEALVKRMQKRYANIHYRRNEKNLGYAPNLAKVLRMGTTDFVWFFGDDDVIQPGAVDAIVKRLRSGNEFVQVNAEVYDEAFRKKVGVMKIRAMEDVSYGIADYGRVLGNAKRGYAGYMAEIITRRTLLLRELEKLDPVEAASMDFVHTVLFFRSIVGKKGTLIARPLIKYRVSAYVGGRDIEIWIKSYPATIAMLRGVYPKEVVGPIGRPQNVLAAAFISKRDHPEKAGENMRYIRESSDLGYLTKIAALAILSTPNIIVKGMEPAITGLYYRISR